MKQECSRFGKFLPKGGKNQLFHQKYFFPWQTLFIMLNIA